MGRHKLNTIFLLLLLSNYVTCQNCYERNDTIYCDNPLDSENHLFLGRVNPNCNDKMNIEPRIIKQYSVTPIKVSKNDIEIRCVREFFQEESSMITLIYNNNKWSYKYQFADLTKEKESHFSRCKNDTSMMESVTHYYEMRLKKKIRYEKTKKSFNLDSLFHILTINNIFDQQDIMFLKNTMYSAYNKVTKKTEDFYGGHTVTDGKNLKIYFKVYETTGNYSLSNVDIYYESYPNNMHLHEQVEISKVFDLISNQ